MRKIAVEEHAVERDTITANLEKRIKDMDGAGIDIQVLSTPFMYSEAPSGAVPAAQKMNEILATVANKYPERFRVFSVLPMLDPEGAAGVLEQAVKQMGFVGGMIFGTVRGEYLDNPRYLPVYEMAAKLDVPLYIHPGALPPDLAAPFSVYPGLDGAMLGYAAVNSLQALRMVLSGLFEKFPGLRIVLGHMGEGLPYWLWRIDSRYWEVRERDAEADKLYQKLKKSPGQYIKDNFYITTSGMFWEPPLICAISAMGADRVLFAVDYPPENINDGSHFIDSAKISNQVREKICHLNAEKVLKIKPL